MIYYSRSPKERHQYTLAACFRSSETISELREFAIDNFNSPSLIMEEVSLFNRHGNRMTLLLTDSEEDCVLLKLRYPGTDVGYFDETGEFVSEE